MKKGTHNLCYMRKPKASKLDPFAEEIQGWFEEEKIPFTEAAQRLKARGCSTSIDNLSKWWRKRRSQALEEQLLDQIEFAGDQCLKLDRAFRKSPAPVIGAAAGAVAFARQESAPDPTTQHRVDEAVREARAVCSEIDSLAPDVSAEQMMRLRARLSHASRLALSAFDPVLDVLGAPTFRASHPVQRLWRDAHVGARHPLILPTP